MGAPTNSMVFPPARPLITTEFIVTVNDNGFIVLSTAVVFVIESVSLPVNGWGVDTVTVPASVDPLGWIESTDGELVIVTSWIVTTC